MNSSRSSWNGVCELCSKTTSREPAMALWMSCMWSTRISSWRPPMTSAGTSISPSRANTSQSRKRPVTVNSLGPFMVSYTTGLISANDRSSPAGQGCSRHR
jgi:hypothetical protein